ncbi:MAG: Nif3-like dinuclear metal center hexameric protein [Ruminococcus sp.]|nr:Nif3-like dinuclear metal center hexameric protein [Ruminococcus sp.]
MIRVKDIYNEIDRIAPFCTQEKWDNSGLLVGDMEMPADRIYICLDISNEAVLAAKKASAQLMISHHPIIFSPLKNLSKSDPVWHLAKADIAALCVHTPLDIAAEGINSRLYEILRERLALGEIKDSLCGSEFGWIAESSRPFRSNEMADILRDTLGCTVVRYTSGDRLIKRIALCSGSGGSFLGGVIEQQCDALITGDVKHDLWYTAKNAGISLFDCGHYHTEKIAAELLAEKLKVAFPEIEIICDESGDPVSYSFREGNI